MCYVHIYACSRSTPHSCDTTSSPDFLVRLGSLARFTLGPDTAARSERYISSLERTDLGVPLEVEFEETQSSGAVGDTIDRNVSAPGAVYNGIKWSINGASFSYDPVALSVTLLFDTGKEIGSRDIRSTLHFYVKIVRTSYYCIYFVQPPLLLDCCLSPTSSPMALSSTGYHQENPTEDHSMRLSMEQMTPTSLQWTLGAETPTTT